MVSIGTDASRAFWYIVRSVGLASTSPPPSRAATSTCRISLANCLPRALSFAPFWCLIVAHFEWPDTSHSFEEQPMDPVVVGQLRMERGGEQRTLAHEHRMPVVRREDLDVVAGALDDRRADEDAVERRIELVDRQVGLEAVDLTPERVAADVDVEHAEALLVGAAVTYALRQEDETRTCAEHGQAVADAGLDGRVQGRGLQQHRHRRRLTAGHHQRVDLLEVAGGTDLAGLSAEGA